MKKIVLTFGLIAGAIVSAMFMITIPLYKSGTLKMENGEIIGYTTMVIALSLIFFGIKSYRDNHLSGMITFGKAFQVGLLIAVVASLFYAISWEIAYHQFFPDFIDQYAAMCMNKAKSEGASPAEMDKTLEKIKFMKDVYQYPVLRFGMTLMEIFPVGLIVALISAGILRKKEILSA